MYPFFRMGLAIWAARRQPPLGLLDPAVLTLRVWPVDLDIWMELNNGRTLTLFDLGRIAMSVRMGFRQLVKAHGWGITVAGTSVRYRKRVTLGQRLECRTQILGWDARFLYVSQSFWRGADCTAAQLLRTAFTSKSGVVPPERVAQALGASPVSPPLPDWVAAWIAAESTRPWPPQV